MYLEMVNNIEKESILVINGVEYKVHSKTYYITRKNKGVWYVKIKLDHQKVLVVSPQDQLIYIGEVIDNMPYTIDADGSITYNNQKYNKVIDDYQLIDEIKFGSKEEVEGECSFTDYEEIDGNHLISLAILSENNQRADVFSEILDIKEIKIKK